MNEQRTPVLHIGWWRNGFHDYGRLEEPRMKPDRIVPSDRDVRNRGAIIAALICAAWTIGGAIGWLLLLPVNSTLAAVPALIAIAGLAALPASCWLGWRYAHDARTGHAFWRMTVLSVLLSDLVVVVTFEVLAAIAVLVNTDPNWLFGVVAAVPGGLLIYSIGLLIFGLPGLILAIPSCWYWEYAMRRSFSWPTRGGGDRGSGDQRR
jgi:hypothetical protein